MKMLLLPFLFTINCLMNSKVRHRRSYVNFVGNIDSSQTIRQNIKEEIQKIVDSYLFTKPGTSFKSINPSLLIENSHILAKQGIYEEIMDEKLNMCDSIEEVTQIEKVDNFLRKFITTERKSRSRLKLNYLMAGATSSRFEQAIQTLSECDEIDDSLLAYTKSLIQKQYQRILGPTADTPNLESDDSNNGYDDTGMLEKVDKTTIDVLMMIHKRLEAELRTLNNPNVKYLGKLLQTRNLQERETIMHTFFSKVEDIESFQLFIRNGIEYLTKLEQKGSEVRNHDDGPTMKKNEYMKSLPVGTIENMKELLYIIDDFKTILVTGLKDQSLYSSTSDINSDKDQLTITEGQDKVDGSFESSGLSDNDFDMLRQQNAAVIDANYESKIKSSKTNRK